MKNGGNQLELHKRQIDIKYTINVQDKISHCRRYDQHAQKIYVVVDKKCVSHNHFATYAQYWTVIPLILRVELVTRELH